MSNFFTLLTADPDPFTSAHAADEAWRRWELESCIERHGEHLWELEIDPEKLDGTFDLHCSYCPAGVDDLYLDGMEFTYGEVDGFPIEEGKHLSPRLFCGPVKVELIIKHYPASSRQSDEYDVWIEVRDV